jgi:hypothetical protein
MESFLNEKIEKLERKYSRLQFAFYLIIILVPIAFVSLAFQNKEKDMLDVKGIIIRDNEGRPRIVMGAPAKGIKGRKRQDELVGIVYLDENGNDRISFGKQPDPMTPEGIVPRRIGASGILIHDKEGIERGGYGVLDDDMAILTLDWPKSGEAVALSSSNAFSAVGIFHKTKVGEYKEAITIGTIPNQSYSFIRFSDTSYNERFLIDAKGMNNVEVKQVKGEK